MPEAALSGLRVLDLSTTVGGGYCSKLLADLGADVWKVEPPGGDPVRRLGPFRDGAEDLENGGLHLHLNANKRSLVADLESDRGRERVRRLAGNVDVVIETAPPGYMAVHGLSYDELRAENPALIYASLTPFGQTGPWRDWLSEDIVEAAVGGYMYWTGHKDREPIMIPGYQAQFQLGMEAAVAILAAVVHQHETGQGQHIDASAMEAYLSAHCWLSTSWTHTGTVLRRTEGDLSRCADGWVFRFGPVTENLFVLIERPDLLADPRFADPMSRFANMDAIKEYFDEWAASRPKMEIYHQAQELRVAMAPLNTMADLVASPQLQARNWFVEVEHPRAGKVLHPGFPYKLSETPPAIRRPAPLLGADDADEPGPRAQASPAATRSGSQPRRNALAGVRVIELTANWAGPFAGRLLADLGAEVIKIELAARPATRGGQYAGGDPMKYHYNRSAYFNKFNRNKYGISLNVAHPAGKAVFFELLRTADLVIENNSARVMRNLGLEFERLHEVNPAVSLISMSGYGATGPEREYLAYGSNIEAACGLASLTGYGPDEPYKTNSYYADPVTGGHGAIAALAVLLARERTGRGQYVDMALNECAIGFFSEAVMDYTLTGHVRTPTSNRSQTGRCVQGAYPTVGLDTWVAIAVRDDAEFARLCAVMGRPELAAQPEFATHAQRLAHHDQLDEQIAAWTQTVDHNEASRLLQQAGVPAAPVLANWELVSNPHLYARGFYEPVAHPEIGVFPYPGAPVKLSETPGSIRMPAPLFAEHNDLVYRNLAGLCDEQLAELDALGLIDTTPTTIGARVRAAAAAR